MNIKFKKGLFTNSQNIITFGVIIISVCALIVSITQTRIMSEQRSLMYEQAKAAVWPRLELEVFRSFSSADNGMKLTNYGLLIGNAGVGPAIITNTRVSYKGEVVKSWQDLFDKFELPDSILRSFSNMTIGKSILKIGQEAKFFEIKDNLQLAQIFSEKSNGVLIEIIYESVYGDQWKLSRNLVGKTIIEDQPFDLIPEEDQFED